MGRTRQGVAPPGVVVGPKTKKRVPKVEDPIKKFLFLNPRPKGLGTPKAPYTRNQNRGHKKPAPKPPKGLVLHKIKVTVRVDLGPELLAKREPGNTQTFKAFNIHTTAVTRRGKFYLCVADPRVIQQLRDKGYKVPNTDLLRIVQLDNPLVWLPTLEKYTWWYPQPRTNPTDPTPSPEV